MTGVSVVVANALDDGPAAAPCLDALRSELRPGDDEILLVDRAGLDPGSLDAAVQVVVAEPDASRGQLYALGHQRASRPVVAFTDTTTVVAPGWRAALVDAVDAGAEIAGGPVAPGRPRTLRGWAGFLVEYAPHAVPPFRSASGDVSGNNLAYRRGVLEGVPTRPLWKSEVNSALRARGVRPHVVPAMLVTSYRTYSWSDLLDQRFHHGRHFAAHRCTGWRPWRRWAVALGSVALPCVFLARLFWLVRHDRTLSRRLVATLPLVAAAFVTWSAGEATGYLTGRGRDVGIF